MINKIIQEIERYNLSDVTIVLDYKVLDHSKIEITCSSYVSDGNSSFNYVFLVVEFKDKIRAGEIFNKLINKIYPGIKNYNFLKGGIA